MIFFGMFGSSTKIEPVIGLDIGSRMIRIAVGQASASGDRHSHVQMLGAVAVPSEGVHRGIVTSIEELVSSLAHGLEQIERAVGFPVESAWVGINGPYLLSQESRGVVAIAKTDGEITPDDVARAVEAAKAVATPLNYDVIHVLPRTFSVDGQTNLKDPVGMTGMRLEVDTKIIYGISTHVKNVSKAVYRTGIDIDDLVLSILADGEAVASSRQRELGVAVVNIGASTTSMVVYEEGDIVHVAVIPIGSEYVTSDIALGLRTSIEIAEEIKLREGYTLSKDISKKDIIDVEGYGGVRGDVASRHYVAEIIEARVSEILEKVNRELLAIGRSGLLPAGIIFTGGGSRIGGLIDLARAELRLPATIGQPIDVGATSDVSFDPAFTTAIGLVKWGVHMNQAPRAQKNPFRQAGKMWEKVRQAREWLMP